MRILALDYGRGNIGVAISDPTNKIAKPLAIIKNNRYLKDHLKKIIEKNEIAEIVIGMNISLSGSLGEESRKNLEKFSIKIADLGVPIRYLDERFSTKIAKKISAENSRKASRRKLVDDIAAALILQNYLDSR